MKETIRTINIYVIWLINNVFGCLINENLIYNIIITTRNVMMLLKLRRIYNL